MVNNLRSQRGENVQEQDRFEALCPNLSVRNLLSDPGSNQYDSVEATGRTRASTSPFLSGSFFRA